MKEGAFALIDCLGWKGIWNRVDSKGLNITSRQILQKIKRIEDYVVSSKKTLKVGYQSFDIDVRPRVLFLSDTVALSVPPVEYPNKEISKEIKGALAVEMACMMVSSIIDSFLDDEPYLSMRGCITYGEHIVQGHTIAGPAVDEAANHYELPQGAFVWLHPKAAMRLEELWGWREPYIKEAKARAKAQLAAEDAELVIRYMSMIHNPPFLIQDFGMPIKGGVNLTSSVINPLFLIRESDQRARTIERYISSFDSDSVDVMLKKQHTISFLTHAADKTLAYYENQFDEVLLERFLGHLKVLRDRVN